MGQRNTVVSLPFDDFAARHYADIRHQLELQGALIGPNDLKIAAIARAHGLKLVSTGTEFFSRAGAANGALELTSARPLSHLRLTRYGLRCTYVAVAAGSVSCAALLASETHFRFGHHAYFRDGSASGCRRTHHRHQRDDGF